MGSPPFVFALEHQGSHNTDLIRPLPCQPKGVSKAPSYVQTEDYHGYVACLISRITERAITGQVRPAPREKLYQGAEHNMPLDGMQAEFRNHNQGMLMILFLLGYLFICL